MADELEKRRSEDELAERLDEAGRTVVKAAAATVVASSLASVLAEPPQTDLITLPEPTPIVQQYQAYDDDELPGDEDEQTDEHQSRWRRLLRALRYLLVALALVGSVALGVLKGCAGVAGSLLAPPSDECEEQPTARRTSDEDERGVAVGAGFAILGVTSR